jgi:hypothetical protein
LDGYQDLDLTIEESPIINLTIEEGSGGVLPYYDGSYSVVPRKIEQTLETKNKSMRDDVTIDPINYSETINPQGGNTVVIGYE